MFHVPSRALSRLPFLAALAIAVSPAQAAPHGGSYVATLASPLAEARQAVIDGKVWKCEGDRCAAPFDASHAVRTCAQVAAKFGAVAAFTTPRGPLAEDQIAACNAHD